MGDPNNLYYPVVAAKNKQNEEYILSNIVISQDLEHKPFKGVVPEIAARSHLFNLELALKQCMSESGIMLKDIDAVAATSGPGLIGGVIVGSMFGKSISSISPIIAGEH